MNLGGLYAYGLGVQKNFVEAYAWFNSATAQGNTRSTRIKDLAKKQLDPASFAEAQALSETYYKKYVMPFQK